MINQFHSFSREDNFLPNVISTKSSCTWPIYLSMKTKYDGASSRDSFNEQPQHMNPACQCGAGDESTTVCLKTTI